jgi:light-regulated signal transduction histidine kinase (bacteriophytochrome)
MDTPTGASFDNLSKAELVKHLQAEREKSGAFFRLLVNMLHDFRMPVTNIRVYAHLLLVPPADELSPLTETQAKYVQSMNVIADRLHMSQEFFSLALRTLQLIHEPSPKEKIVLAELEILEKLTPNGLNTLPAIHAPRRDVLTAMDLLTFMQSDGLELSFAVDGDWVRVSSSHLANRPYWFERSFTPETGQLRYEESVAGYEPVGLLIALVEKNGGAVFAELGGDSTYSLSFTLPVYKQES